MEARIHPSILNCDVLSLGGELDKISSADMVHVDVMDNHFVPNLSWGLPVTEAAIRHGRLPVDAHLMIENPDRWAPAYAEAGCASVTFHVEAASAPIRLAREIHRLGAQVGLALNPGTSASAAEELLPFVDMVLVMTVEPGFGGQSFIGQAMGKVSEIRRQISAANLKVGIQVDGGVTRETIEVAAQAGADIFVAGSAVFKAADAHAEIAALREIAARHLH